MNESTPSNVVRWFGYGLFVLAGGLAANSLLGPLLLETIQYHYSTSLINQGIGLDVVALGAAAPLAVAAGVLVLRGRQAGPVLAFIPSALPCTWFLSTWLGLTT